VPSIKKRLVALFAVLSALVVVACANDVDMGDVKNPGDTPPPFTPAADASGDADGGGNSALSCIGTTCPAPWATCLSESGPTYKCGTDLTRDVDNCGACGNKCLTYKPLHMVSRCIDAQCALECYSPPPVGDPVEWRNCNGLVDDGCEVDVMKDPKNCGGCGTVCAAGQSCIIGKCGCPAGKIECNGYCVDPKTDDFNCGRCGNQCEPPAGACDPMPPNSGYGCINGTCGHLKCLGQSADCNGDLTTASCGGNGCEIENIFADKNNCGGCGVKCKAGEECVDEGNGPECAIPCKRFGKTACPDGRCVDLLTDLSACGSCASPCRGPGPHEKASCSKGLCQYECTPGWGDCNGDPSDGCETNLLSHPGNCGACGTACDVGAGQPCIEGKCLTTACAPGQTR